MYQSKHLTDERILTEKLTEITQCTGLLWRDLIKCVFQLKNIHFHLNVKEPRTEIALNSNFWINQLADSLSKNG